MRPARFALIAGIVGLVALSVVWFGVASRPPTAVQAVMATTVNIGDNWYSNSMTNNCGSPCVTNIGVGDTVHWVWLAADSHMHSTTSDMGGWDSGQHTSGNTFDQVFNTAGTYSYHCTVHPSMHGTIIVGPTPGGRNGDVNCSGSVDAIDAALILQLSAGLVHSLSCQQNGDVNGDGQINSIDAALVLQFSAGLIGHLPT